MSQATIFAARLRAERERQGLSQADLATRSGFGPSVISHFETGRRMPSLANFCRLVEALGVSADSLLGLAPARAGHPVNRERRERIATATMQGLLTNTTLRYTDTAASAVRMADALIAEIDKPKEAQGG